MIRRFIAVFCLLWFSVLLSSCEEKKTVRIGISVWPAHAYAFVAQEKGFFDKHGVSVELVLKEDTGDIYELYKFEQLDGFFGVFSDVIMLNANTFLTQVVYVPEYTDTADVIIGRANIESLSDLKGKTISFEGVYSFSHLFVSRILEEAGLSEGEYQVRNIPSQQLLIALENKQVDAGHTWEPITSQALAKGYKILGKAGDFPTLITGTIALNKNFVDTYPEMVEALIAAFMEAKEFAERNPDEALSIMTKAEGMSKEAMLSGINGVHFVSLDDNIEFMTPKGRLFDTAKKVADFYEQKGQFIHQLNMESIINRQFVQAIKAKK